MKSSACNFKENGSLLGAESVDGPTDVAAGVIGLDVIDDQHSTGSAEARPLRIGDGLVVVISRQSILINKCVDQIII